MGHLRNRSIFFLLLSFSISCQTIPVFEIQTFQTKADDLQLIHLKSNRIRQTCLFLNAESENNWRHQYFMYLLNSKNEVLEIMHSTNQDKTTCEAQKKAIEKVIESESQVKLCVRGELKSTVPKSKLRSELIDFGKTGHYQPSYETLTLDSICNSKECFSNNGVWVNTCPGFVHQ